MEQGESYFIIAAPGSFYLFLKIFLTVTVRSILLTHVIRHAFRAVVHPYFRTEYFGVENVPKTGPVILTPNHVAYLDPFWIGCALPRPVHYMTWSASFQVPVLRPFLWFFQCFPVDIDSGGIDRSALRKAQEVLEAGEALMIFPEGGRCVSGTIDPFKAGAFRLAIKLGVPVVPVTLSGVHDIWPLGQLIPRPGKIQVYYHPPQTFQADRGEIRTRAYEAAEQVRAQIATRLDVRYQPTDLKLTKTISMEVRGTSPTEETA